MDITSIGQRGYGNALAKAAAYSEKIVENGGEVDDLIGLKIAEGEAKIATRVIKAGIEIEDALLDILA